MAGINVTVKCSEIEPIRDFIKETYETCNKYKIRDTHKNHQAAFADIVIAYNKLAERIGLVELED